jgi:hypothetical protein
VSKYKEMLKNWHIANLSNEGKLDTIKDILEDRTKGIVVIWDEQLMTWIDYSSGVPGHHAAEFATKYRDSVLKQSGLKDFMYEELWETPNDQA